jgi:hypothetical protein
VLKKVLTAFTEVSLLLVLKQRIAFTAGDMHILIQANTTVYQYMFNSTILGQDQQHFFVL